MTKKQQKRWEIILETKDFIKDNLGLSNWNIVLSGIANMKSDEGSDARLNQCLYNYFQAEIEFDNRFIYGDEKSEFEGLFLLILHEICHIFTSQGKNYFDEQEQNLLNDFSYTKYTMHSNAMMFVEEQLTNILDKAIFNMLENTKGYKELKKKYNNI